MTSSNWNISAILSLLRGSHRSPVNSRHLKSRSSGRHCNGLASSYSSPSTPAVGHTKSPFVNLSIKKMLWQKYISTQPDHIHIWQISPQISCNENSEISTYYWWSKQYFDHSQERGTIIEEIGLVNPTPFSSDLRHSNFFGKVTCDYRHDFFALSNVYIICFKNTQHAILTHPP